MKGDPRLLIHTPAELASEHIAWAERIQATPGVPWGVPAIDKRVIPMHPGDLIGLMGRPGHGKSTLMAIFARAEADRILARGKEEHEAVVYVTWESSAEELENFFAADQNNSASDVAWGRADLDTLKRKAVKRARVPIWVIGHGIGRVSTDTPRMTVEAVYAAIESLNDDFGVTPTLVLLDYLQIIPIDHAVERTAQVSEAAIRAKELAQRVGTPIVAGVQASRSVDHYKQPIPTKSDAQWASSIEQVVDKLFSLWRPALSKIKEAIFLEGVPGPVEVTEYLLIIRMLKQRFEQGRWTWPMYFEPQYLKLAEMELRNARERDESVRSLQDS